LHLAEFAGIAQAMVDWRQRVIGLGISGLISFGCGGPHVQLSAPPANSPAEQRAAAYEQLRPLSMHETHTTYVRGGAVVGATRSTDYLQLNDGRRVYHAEDVLPVVPPSSPAATAAEESDSNASTATALTITAYGMVGAGLAISTVPLLTKEPGEDLNLTPLYIGLGVVVLAMVPAILAGSFRRTANDEKATAFETYDAGLRRQLNLCERNQVVVPCQ
jgi:hypothetical protein